MITEQGHSKIELGDHLIEQLEAKWGILSQYLAHSAPDLYCNWEII